MGTPQSETDERGVDPAERPSRRRGNIRLPFKGKPLMGLLDGILSSVLGNLGGSIGSSMGGSPSVNSGGGNTGNSGGPFGSTLGRIGGNVAVSAMVALAFQMLQQNGGLSGLIDKLRGSGLGQHASSWVSTGTNLPVSGQQLQEALGSDQIAELASRFGMTTEQASAGLAQVLPEVVNHMTPSGELPANDHDMISDALAQLKPRA
jgi:uncharacterized protein YidB (DUF937 family)